MRTERAYFLAEAAAFVPPLALFAAQYAFIFSLCALRSAGVRFRPLRVAAEGCEVCLEATLVPPNSARIASISSSILAFCLISSCNANSNKRFFSICHLRFSQVNNDSPEIENRKLKYTLDIKMSDI
jgi:hypothetical protein